MNPAHPFLSEQELGQAYRVSSLISGYIHQTLTPEEHEELDHWVDASDDNMRLFEELTNKKNIQHTLQWLDAIDSEAALQKIKVHPSFESARNKRTFNARLMLYSIAAIFLIAIVVVWLSRPLEKTPIQIAHNIQTDRAPGGMHATLQLSEGKNILLDSASHQHSIAGATLSKGKLSYDNANASINNEIAFHTLQTPPGGMFQLVLPDGSSAWLNASSSIYFPTVFASNERRVSITGEVYFEVAKKSGSKFIVDVNGMQVEVLGTHFNINAYPDEPTVSTTLLEGKVKVMRTIAGQTKEVLLMPGQQALLQQGSLHVSANVDIDNIIGWQRGEFRFDDATIATIGRQLSRWYNIQFSYEGDTSFHFNGHFPRNLPLSKLLGMLEGTGRVHFTQQNNTVIARP